MNVISPADELQTEIESVLRPRNQPAAEELKTMSVKPFLFWAVCASLAAVLFISVGLIVWMSYHMRDRSESQTIIADTTPSNVSDSRGAVYRKNIDNYDEAKAETLKNTLQAMSQVSRKYDLNGCRYWTTSCDMNIQGTLLATGTGDEDSNARIFNLATDRPSRNMPHEGGVQGVAFHPVLPRLITTDKQGDVHVWSCDTCEKLADYTLPNEGKAFRIALSRDGKYLIAGTTTGQIFALDGKTGELIQDFHSPEHGEIRGISFHPDNKTFATVGQEKIMHFWDVGHSEPIRTIVDVTAGEPHFLCFSPTGSRIAVTAEWSDKYANVYRVDTGELLANYGGYGEDIRAVNFSPDERFVITGDVNYRVVIWDAQTKLPVWADSRHQGNHTYRVILTPSQNRLVVAAGYNPTIYEMPSDIIIE